ncbi:Pollen-specific protein C13 [Camellia lanceoleosa]|uniref:Pollen-specific protein C13 n=1 Tax=Camellia lanceoleosa TaxID=1840588 RepID=A0ACC0HMX5_9ERIC|nr:Pollen-specific protein C13 [Camellia lanceoleosa]
MPSAPNSTLLTNISFLLHFLSSTHTVHTFYFHFTLSLSLCIYIYMILCMLPALVSANRPVANPLIVEGRVYCDTCRAGYETNATTPIPGTKVKIECKDRDTHKLLYSTDGTTDSTGKYTIMIKEDHGDQLCDAMLVSSP